MKKIFAKKWLLFLLLILSVGGWFTGRNFLFPKKSIKHQNYSVKKGDIEISIRATGKVLPESRVEIKPPVAGRIEEIRVEEGKYVKKGQLLAQMSSTERATFIDVTRSQKDKDLSALDDVFLPAPIIAPLDGLIISVNVQQGQMVAISDVGIVLASRMTIVAQVDETDLDRISEKQNVSVTLDAYPGKIFSGKVKQIALESKTTNNVTIFEIKIYLDEKSALLRSGMTANAKFEGPFVRDALIVPTEFIKTENGKPFVLIKKNEAIPAVKIEIKTGLTDGRMTEVKEGLKVNDEILLVLENENDKPKSGSNPFTPFGGSKKPPGTGR